MNDDRSIERAARSWLEAGPTKAPDRAVDAALSRIQTTRQERDLRVPWRFPTMNPITRIAMVAAALAVAVGVAFYVFRPPSQIGPAASPTTNPPGPTSTSTSPVVPTGTPIPTVNESDVGRTLPPGTYRVDGFAAPFTVTLPAGWAVNELTPTSVSLALASDASVNVFLAVISKVYPDPCRGGPGGPSPIGRAVDDLVASLAAMPGFEVSSLEDGAIGGAAGKVFLFRNSNPSGSRTCAAVLDTYTFATHADNGQDVGIVIFGGETDQFWVVDAGGTTVLVAVTDNRVLAVQPVLDTISFIGATAGPGSQPDAGGTRPIPDGVYAADVPVAQVLAGLIADATLSLDDRSSIEESLNLRTAQTLHVRLTVVDGEFSLETAFDAGEPVRDRTWGIRALDADTIVLKDIWLVPGDYGHHDVLWNTDHTGFTLTSRFTGAADVQAFVMHAIFNSGEFRLVG